MNLTLVDLPGLTKVAVGMNFSTSFYLMDFMKVIYTIFYFPEGQPETIVEDIESMVRTYVDKVRNCHFFHLYTDVERVYFLK